MSDPFGSPLAELYAAELELIVRVRLFPVRLLSTKVPEPVPIPDISPSLLIVIPLFSRPPSARFSNDEPFHLGRIPAVFPNVPAISIPNPPLAGGTVVLMLSVPLVKSGMPVAADTS